jgi:hypothetical protein
METFFIANRGLHILAGFVGFFVAPLALATRKGGPAHRRWGRAFFWAMVVAGGTALIGAQHVHSLFLFLTAIFSLYMAGFGYRSLYLKHLAGSTHVSWVDWLTAGVGLNIFVATMAYGLKQGNIPVLVFGGIGAFTALRQLLSYRRAGFWNKQQWLLNHISGFMAAYIAAVSAFSVTSLRFIPPSINFLWATVVGVPVIIWWQRRVRKGNWQ